MPLSAIWRFAHLCRGCSIEKIVCGLLRKETECFLSFPHSCSRLGVQCLYSSKSIKEMHWKRQFNENPQTQAVTHKPVLGTVVRLISGVRAVCNSLDCPPDEQPVEMVHPWCKTWTIWLFGSSLSCK